MRVVRLFTILLSIGYFGNPARSQGTNSWADATFPATGANAGFINVKGIVSPAAGWNISGNTVSIWIWQDDKEVKKFVTTVNVANGKWGDSAGTWIASGCQTGVSNVKFNVIVEAKVTDGTKTVSLLTRPRVATSK